MRKLPSLKTGTELSMLDRGKLGILLAAISLPALALSCRASMSELLQWPEGAREAAVGKENVKVFTVDKAGAHVSLKRFSKADGSTFIDGMVMLYPGSPLREPASDSDYELPKEAYPWIKMTGWPNGKITLHIEGDQIKMEFDGCTTGPSDNLTACRGVEVGLDSNARTEATPEATPEITWLSNYNEAIKQARAQNKTIVVDFFATWCEPCSLMDRVTFSDPEVRKKLKEFVLLKIDVDKEPEISNKYEVKGLPSTMNIDANGSVIAGPKVGFMPADDYLRVLSEFRAPSGNAAGVDAGPIDAGILTDAAADANSEVGINKSAILAALSLLDQVKLHEIAKALLPAGEIIPSPDDAKRTIRTWLKNGKISWQGLASEIAKKTLITI